MNIHSNYKKIYEEKPVRAVSAFTTGNYHCKPLMTDVLVIHMTDVTVIHQVNMWNKIRETRGPLGHILDTGIRCFRAARMGVSRAAQ